jgi:biopolymer transport protein ExbD
MSFETHAEDEVMSEINMTPLVDVMLVLLIVFIITVPVIQHAVKIDLPQASSQRHQPASTQLQLALDAEGQLTLDGQAVPADALEDRLREQAGRQPQPQLVLRGDRQVPYEHVAHAMAAAQRAGLTQIGFVTQSTRP